MTTNHNNHSEPWLDEIRQSLADHQEPLPADGWERLSASLGIAEQPNAAPVPQPQRKPLTPWLRRASVILLALIAGAVGYFIFDRNTPADVVISMGNEPLLPSTPSSTHSPSSPLVNASSPETLVNASSPETLVNASSPETLANASSPTLLATNPPIADTPPIENNPPIPNNPFIEEEEAVLLAMEANSARLASSSHGWEVGLRLGNNGMKRGQDVSSTLGPHNGSYLFGEGGFHPSGISVEESDQVSDTFFGFDNTQPGYASPQEDRLLGSSHHMSWSAGLAVSKRLTDRLALESGLVYTYLTSDVTMLCAGKQRQQLHYLGIPLKGNLILTNPTAHWQCYATAGTMVERCLYGSRGRQSLSVDAWQWSVSGALGLQYRLSDHMGLYVEPGIYYYFDDRSAIPTLRSEQPLTFNLEMGIRFEL